MNPVDWGEISPEFQKRILDAIPEVELDPSLPRGVVEEREPGQLPRQTDLQEFLDRFRDRA